MEIKEIEASQAILEFLLESHEDSEIGGFVSTKSIQMDRALSEFDLPDGNPMCQFTEMMNSKYKIMSEPLWIKSPKEFFSTERSILFFNKILRDKRIDSILN